MNKKYKKIMLPFFIVIIPIFITIILIISKKEQPKKEITPFIPNIKTLLAKKEIFTFYIDSEGHIESKYKFPLISEVSGKILFLSEYFNDNLIFKEGDTLVVIDSTNYSIARRNAKANLDIAKLEKLRQEAIHKRSQNELTEYKYVNANELAKKIPQLESSQSSFDAAKANYEKREEDLKKTIILAPFKGRVQNNDSSKGKYASVGMHLATIYSVDDMFVKLPLSIEDITYLGLEKNMDGVIINSEDILIDLTAVVGSKEYLMKGKYMGISGYVDNLTQKVYLNVSIDEFKNTDLIIDENLFINAKIYGNKYKDVFLIPNIAINDGGYLYIVENNKLFKKKVEIFKQYEDISIIKSGLAGNEIINLTPLEYYIDGMKVNIIE